MAWKTRDLETVLDGPRDPTWYLFEHVAPLLDIFIRTGKIVSLEVAIADEAAALGVSAASFVQNSRENAALALQLYLEEAVPHMHAAAGFFSRYQRPARGQNGQLFDNHSFQDYGAYMAAVSSHAANLRKHSRGLSVDTLSAVTVTADFNHKETGMTLNKPVHLGFRHGSHGIDTSSPFPVVFQISRVKNPTRFGNKFARYICEGLQELPEFQRALKDSSQPNKIPSKVREALGGMRYFGLSTPFSGNHGFNGMEFLFVRSRVSDLCGVFYVTRTEEEVRGFLDTLINSRFPAASHYEILRGYRLVKRGSWGFEEQPLVDDHYVTGSRELVSSGAANQNIFMYVVPRSKGKTFDPRIDFGISHLAGYYQDLPPHEGSHILYEARQDAKVDNWSRQYSLLYRHICHEIAQITSRMVVQKYNLYPQALFPTNSFALDQGFVAK